MQDSSAENGALAPAGGKRRAARRKATSIATLLKVVLGLMASVLVVAFSVSAVYAYRSEMNAAHVLAVTDVTRDIFDTMKYLRIERGTVSTALAAPDAASASVRGEIAMLRARADKAFESAIKKLKGGQFPGVETSLAGIARTRMLLTRSRAAADAALLLPRDRRVQSLNDSWIASNNALVDAIDDMSESLPAMGQRADPFVVQMMNIKRLAWLTSDSAGLDRLMVGVAIADGKRLSIEQREDIARQISRFVTPWRIVRNEVRLDRVPVALAGVVKTADRIYFTDVCNERKTIVAALAAGKSSPVSYDAWLRHSKLGLDRVLAVANTAVDLAAAHAENQADYARRLFYISILGVALFAGFGVFSIFFVEQRVIAPMEQITATMRTVADGNLDVVVPFEDRSNEIGDLARALGVFRANAIEKKRMERELIESKNLAESSNRAKSQFLANMSHELRTPLNAVIGFADMMSSETFGPLGSKRYGEYADAIRSSGAHLLSLINDILDLSRLDAGQTTLADEELNIDEIAELSLTMVAEQARNAKLVLTKNVASGLPPLRADARRVKQVLINLLANAIKFTPAGGEVRLSATLSRAGDLQMNVSDTGIGIAREDIPKALERFGQVDSKLSRRYEGAGLGLPLAKQLMELHGGSLTLESELHIGTIVTVTFPRARLVSPAPSAVA